MSRTSASSSGNERVRNSRRLIFEKTSGIGGSPVNGPLQGSKVGFQVWMAAGLTRGLAALLMAVLIVASATMETPN
jgi:hypothetical protein